MNLGAHIVLAATSSDSPVHHLGSALPDIATIGRFRMLPLADRAGIDADLAEGIAFHHTTDAVFHAHPWFTGLQKTVFDELTASAVGRGAARAAAHVGVELLLDGALFADRPDRSSVVYAAFEAVPSSGGIGSVVPDPDEQRWGQHLKGLLRWPTPTYFSDPAAVADRLRDILASRPRLAMKPDETERVAQSLSGVQSSIVATAEEFLEELATTLAAPPQ